MSYAPDGEFLYEHPDADSLVWRRQVYALFRHPEVLAAAVDSISWALRRGEIAPSDRARVERAFEHLSRVWFRWKFVPKRVVIGMLGASVSGIPVQDVVDCLRETSSVDEVVDKMCERSPGFTHDDVVAAQVWAESEP
jgi:hypothetical protein